MNVVERGGRIFLVKGEDRSVSDIRLLFDAGLRCHLLSPNTELGTAGPPSVPIGLADVRRRRIDRSALERRAVAIDKTQVQSANAVPLRGREFRSHRRMQPNTRQSVAHDSRLESEAEERSTQHVAGTRRLHVQVQPHVGGGR